VGDGLADRAAVDLGKWSFGMGALVLWATRLRRLNGPNFTWPLLQFSGVVPERWLERSGVLYGGQPLPSGRATICWTRFGRIGGVPSTRPARHAASPPNRDGGGVRWAPRPDRPT